MSLDVAVSRCYCVIHSLACRLVQVDTSTLVLVAVSNADSAVTELPRISALVFLWSYDLRYSVLLVLDNGRLVNQHKVDVEAVARLGIAARAIRAEQ